MDASIKDDLMTEIEGLPPELLHLVLAFVRSLAVKGVSGKSLLRFEGSIPSEDLEQMSRAIEEGCEKVDTSEW